MTTDRIKEIQSKTAYPNSVSVQQALLQVWNECEQEQLRIANVSKSLKVDIQHFDLKDCPYQINTFLHQHKIEKEHIISFSRSDKYLTMVYQDF